MNYYLEVWRDYFDFSGRARRKEYWLFTLIHTLIAAAGEIVYATTYPENGALANVIGIVLLLYILASLIPSIAVAVRRLHDIDKSGWWYFIAMIPFIGPIWFLVLMCTDGTLGPNRYGNDPKDLQSVSTAGATG